MFPIEYGKYKVCTVPEGIVLVFVGGVTMHHSATVHMHAYKDNTTTSTPSPHLHHV